MDIDQVEAGRVSPRPVAHRLARARRPNARMLAGETCVAFAVRPVAAGESSAQRLTERLAALGFGDAEIIPIDSLAARRVGTLRALRIAAMRLAVPVVLVHRRRAYLSGALRALMALLAARPTRGRT